MSVVKDMFLAQTLGGNGGGGSSGGGVLVVHVDADTGSVLDKTWAEIYAAAPSVYYLVSIGGGEGEYFADFFGSLGAGIMEAQTDSESGYPIII